MTPNNGSPTGKLVSVVMPTYDRPELVQAAAESVAAQTYDPIELVIVDDCSPTPIEGTLDREALGSLSVRVLRHEENQGANAARNNGIETVNGEFIAFLDDDDRWEAEKIARQVDAFESGGPSVGVVCVGQRFVDADGETTQLRMPNAEGTVTEAVFAGATLGPFSTVMVRASVVAEAGLPDERFPAWQDIEWHLRLSRHCSYAIVREPLTIRQVGDHDQIGDDFDAQREAASLYLGKHRSFAATYGKEAERNITADAYGGVASVALSAGRYRECARYSLRTLRYDPFAVKWYVHLGVSLGGPRALGAVRRLRGAYHRASERLG